MFFIFLWGVLLRLSFIIKPEGLWNDEYVSWFVANTPFKEDFFHQIFVQCHMPLYYFYLKPFTGLSDTILRLTSVIPGILSIIVMYYLGKEYSKKVGYFSAIITSCLSFLVYYSQEVRFYSLVFFFTTLSLFFTVRLLKNAAKTNITGYVISSLLIVLTHILGVIYVFFNTCYVIYKTRNKKLRISWIVFTLIAIILSACFLPNILKMMKYSQWWGHFTYTNVLFLFSDFFSPILTNHVNAPPVFFYNPKLALWMTIPTIIGILGMIAGCKNNKGLTSISAFTLVVLFTLASSEKIVFITKYTIEVLPIFILLCACGFARLNKLGTGLLIMLIAFHSLSFFTPYYVTKQPRKEGHRIVGEIINARKPETALFTYYSPDRFARYTDLEKIKTYHISKINRFQYLENPAEILSAVKSKEKISVVFLDSVSFFDEKFLEANKDNSKLPEMFVTFSKIKNSLIKTLDKEYTNYQVDKIGSWTVITAIKK